MIDMLVVTSMFAGPQKDGIFKRRRAENQGEKPHGQFRLEGNMREKPVISERDAYAGRCQKREKKRYLKPVDPEMPDVSRHGRESENKRSDQERAGRPINAIGGETKDHWLWLGGVWRDNLGYGCR